MESGVGDEKKSLSGDGEAVNSDFLALRGALDFGGQIRARLHPILLMAQGIPRSLAMLSDIRDALFFGGLAMTQKSYREQAGAAVQSARHLTPEVRDFLSQIELFGENALSKVDAWLAAAEKIGELQAERSRLTSDEDDSVTRGDLRDARFGWIRAMNALRNMLDFTDIDDDTRRRVLADLWDAQAQARRAAARSGDVEPQDSDPVPEPLST